MLKLNGRPLQLKQEPGAVRKVIALLDKSPEDEVFLTADVIQKSGVSSTSLSTAVRTGSLNNHSALVGKHRYWGNPRAIAELVKQAGL